MKKETSIFETNAGIFKAFSDEKRLKILDLLRGGELCACQLIDTLGIGQPNLSHHMKILVASGVVSRRKNGRWMHYSISPRGRERAIRLLMDVTSAGIDPEESESQIIVSEPRVRKKR